MKYRKKPIVIEAVKYTGDNEEEITTFVGEGVLDSNSPHNERTLYIQTLEGTMRANENDWIIKGVKGEFYPCKPDIFEATYDLVED